MFFASLMNLFSFLFFCSFFSVIREPYLLSWFVTYFVAFSDEAHVLGISLGSFSVTEICCVTSFVCISCWFHANLMYGVSRCFCLSTFSICNYFYL